MRRSFPSDKKANHFLLPGVLTGPPQAVAQQPSRGLKRSRSPENSYADVQQGDYDGR